MYRLRESRHLAI